MVWSNLFVKAHYGVRTGSLQQYQQQHRCYIALLAEHYTVVHKVVIANGAMLQVQETPKYQIVKLFKALSAHGCLSEGRSMQFSIELRKAERTGFRSYSVPYPLAGGDGTQRGIQVQGCWMKRSGGWVLPEDLCCVGWVAREWERNLMLADLNAREEIEVSAFSYKACLLGLGLWYIQVGFGRGGKETEWEKTLRL